MFYSQLPVLVQYGLAAILGYLLGSLPTAYLIGRQKNIDIRKAGSGNVGATNTFRVFGKGAGIFVLIIDIWKGFLSVSLFQSFTPEFQDKHYILLVSGTFAALGHMFPVWLSFKGGKGVATMTGVVLALSPVQLAIAFAAFLIALMAFKMVSLGSIIAVLTLPLSYIWLYGYNQNSPLFIFFVSLSVLIVFMHRANIKRIFQGAESKIGSSKNKK